MKSGTDSVKMVIPVLKRTLAHNISTFLVLGMLKLEEITLKFTLTAHTQQRQAPTL